MSNVVVTCFYLIQPKPGRSHILYKEWFNNLLNCLNTRIIVFTDNKSKEYLNVSNPRINYQILPFDELYYFKNYGVNFWKEQQKKDPNKNRHWKLSVLYNEKCRFIQKAIRLYPNGERYVWCDFGCFRQKIDIKFPQTTHLNSNKITLLQLKRFKRNEYNMNYLFDPEKQVRLGGGVQVATKNVWKKWIELYDLTFLDYAKNSSVNCDQGLLATMCIKNHELVDLIKAKKTKKTNDKWFYLLEYCSESYKVNNNFFSSFIKHLRNH